MPEPTHAAPRPHVTELVAARPELAGIGTAVDVADLGVSAA